MKTVLYEYVRTWCQSKQWIVILTWLAEYFIGMKLKFGIVGNSYHGNCGMDIGMIISAKNGPCCGGEYKD